MRQCDFEVGIVGQGIAGSCLAMQFIEKGIPVCVFDEGKEISSSKVAAGMVNPITGRRFALSWKFNEWNKIARDFYGKIEAQFNRSLIQELELFRTVNDLAHLDHVIIRSGEPPFDQYIEYLKSIPEYLKLPEGCPGLFRIKNAWRLKVVDLLSIVNVHLLELSAFYKQRVAYNDIRKSGDFWEINSVLCKYIIFCCGAEDVKNPFFENAPFQLNKGQALVIKGQSDNVAIKNKIFKVPYDKDKTWLGTTNHWEWEDEEPEELVTQKMLDDYAHCFTDSPVFVRSVAAIRPATITRRPIILKSDQDNNMFLMGGLGSKGSLIAPGLALYLANHIVHGNLIPDLQ